MMSALIVLVGILAAFLPGSTIPAGGYDFPAKQWSNMVARLHVQVADEPDAAGFARVRLTINVEGPPTLEVEPALLGDATDAWKIQRASAWRIDDGKSRCEQSFDLRQVKAGLVPIPSVKVRCRVNETAAWEEMEWTNILANLHGLPMPTVPSPPASLVPWWVWVAAVPIGVVLLAAALGGVFWRWRRRPAPRVLSHGERALAELQQLQAALPTHDPRAFAEALSALLRRYVAERFALPALRQTTAEFLAAVHETPAIEPAQQNQLCLFLERCDLVKFAGASPAIEESLAMVQFVATFIREGEQSANSTQGNKAETRSATHGA